MTNDTETNEKTSDNCEGTRQDVRTRQNRASTQFNAQRTTHTHQHISTCFGSNHVTTCDDLQVHIWPREHTATPSRPRVGEAEQSWHERRDRPTDTLSMSTVRVRPRIEACARTHRPQCRIEGPAGASHPDCGHPTIRVHPTLIVVTG